MNFLALVCPDNRRIFAMPETVQSFAIHFQQLPLYGIGLRAKSNELQIIKRNNVTQLPAKFVSSIFAVIAGRNASASAKKGFVPRRLIGWNDACQRCHEALAPWFRKALSLQVPPLMKNQEDQTKHTDVADWQKVSEKWCRRTDTCRALCQKCSTVFSSMIFVTNNFRKSCPRLLGNREKPG